ncbi:MAG: hypothetical protein ACI97A_004474 [Planctomycetota bacterium]|jgi:hypothetical protein
MSRLFVFIVVSMVMILGFQSQGLEAGETMGNAEAKLLFVKPPYIHISKFHKKTNKSDIVLKVYVCVHAPKDGVATTTSCKESSEKKNMGNVTSAEIKITDGRGNTTYCTVKNPDCLDDRWKGYDDLEFDYDFEPRTEYSVTLTVTSRNNIISTTTHKGVTLRTP